ncbi:hypothetical protein [Thermaerobacillus caldiproteolyticus]|uniref:hypothetical protein n=1 Tax=Thermaerobacillus caldiproteolyticus TaxID=247480 RepID=UPI00188A444C|nr:hypothetical protein [Anoxybacillus caldiproteolyticus]QPA31640.1 hypothetical protein ISX45_01050 [Anoxybacillus caldiproteolyticus]
MSKVNTLYSDLLILDSEADYKQYYIEEYCNKDIYTHDGIKVKFPPNQFEHSFFESANRRQKDKSIFSRERAERLSWIKKVLNDPSLQLYAGWDSKKRRYDHTRRVCLVTPDRYVVILRMINPRLASFVTAYVIDNDDNLAKIKASPIWNPSFS